MSVDLSTADQNARSRNAAARKLGALGESLAREYLENVVGCRIVMANFRTPIGRNLRGALIFGEIDLIALDGETLCFIEVKTRSSADFADPLTAVDLRKQRQIIRTARFYRLIFNAHRFQCRFDALTEIVGPDGRPSIEYSRQHWFESQFRKRRWVSDASFTIFPEPFSRFRR